MVEGDVLVGGGGAVTKSGKLCSAQDKVGDSAVAAGTVELVYLSPLVYLFDIGGVPQGNTIAAACAGERPYIVSLL